VLSAPKHKSLAYRNMWRLLRSSQFLVGGAVVAVIIIMAIFAPWIAPYEPFERDRDSRLEKPSLEHLFGTDWLGRDLFSQIVYGSRLTLYIGFVSVGIALTVGVALGITAGYFGGWWNTLVTAVVDVMLAFPSFVLALSIVAVLGPSLTNAMIAVGVRGIPVFARLARGEALRLRETEYIEAAKALGATNARVIWSSLLPNAFSPLLVMATLQFPFAILMTAGLSFLGLGAQPPTAEWGRLIVGARDLLMEAPWLVNIPGMAIMATVIGFNLLGNALRDVLDPRLQD